MSYNLVVRTEGGVSRVVSEANVPDGEHQVSGHDDAQRLDVAIQRRGTDGRFVVSASHSHSKES